MTGLKLLHHLWCAYDVWRCLGSNWRSFGGKADDQRPADYLEGLLVLEVTILALKNGAGTEAEEPLPDHHAKQLM